MCYGNFSVVWDHAVSESVCDAERCVRPVFNILYSVFNLHVVVASYND